MCSSRRDHCTTATHMRGPPDGGIVVRLVWHDSLVPAVGGRIRRWSRARIGFVQWTMAICPRDRAFPLAIISYLKKYSATVESGDGVICPIEDNLGTARYPKLPPIWQEAISPSFIFRTVHTSTRSALMVSTCPVPSLLYNNHSWCAQMPGGAESHWDGRGGPESHKLQAAAYNRLSGLDSTA
jgi:hypothetical protein